MSNEKKYIYIVSMYCLIFSLLSVMQQFFIYFIYFYFFVYFFLFFFSCLVLFLVWEGGGSRFFLFLFCMSTILINGTKTYLLNLHMSVICSERYILVVRFVDIGNIVDHHCLNFLFIDMYYWTHLQACKYDLYWPYPPHFMIYTDKIFCVIPVFAQRINLFSTTKSSISIRIVR